MHRIAVDGIIRRDGQIDDLPAIAELPQLLPRLYPVQLRHDDVQKIEVKPSGLLCLVEQLLPALEGVDLPGQLPMKAQIFLNKMDNPLYMPRIVIANRYAERHLLILSS